MRINGLIASGTIAVMAVTGMAIGSVHSTPANASGSTIATTTESKVMLSSNCYETYETEITYYTHSVTKGWVREPSPKVVKTKKETCDK